MEKSMAIRTFQGDQGCVTVGPRAVSIEFVLNLFIKKYNEVKYWEF